MKKTWKVFSFAFALALAGGMTTGMTAMASAESVGTAQSGTATIAETTAEAQVYLVPGEGNALSGTKLTEAELTALHMEGDVYKAGAVGSALPTPTTTKKDKSNNLFAFNGWWTIVDATVTYYTTVPEVEENTYLYADFRAALSQPQAPVAPAASEGTTYKDYMLVTRAETDAVEYIPLYVSGSDVPNAVGRSAYGGPVQWYNEWFTLAPGDTISFYISGVYGNQPMACPRAAGSPRRCHMTMESSGQYGLTPQFLSSVNGDGGYQAGGDDFFNALAAGEAPVFAYEGTYAKREHNFRCYIKFYDEGGTMTLYMENMDAKLGLGELI